ncbi:TIR domain-containing protein [Candidatus Bathyarchaeota archaeon]|nr:MAG: TIR domain-containing protein [Candidatus Bathyarchaeota archaeon]
MAVNNLIFKQNLHRLVIFYSVLIRFVDTFFSGYTIQTSNQVNLQYLKICNKINELLNNQGFEEIKKHHWRPFDNLLNFDPDYPEGDWELGEKQRCSDFLSTIQELYIQNGSSSFNLNDEDKTLLKNIEDFLDEYIIEKKEADSSFLDRIENMSNENPLSENQNDSNDIKIFLSYSYKDRHIASQIKTHLETSGLTVFMAHDDIKPSLEWQIVIVDELKKCDMFIPLFSKNFRESSWADQEIGIAFGHGKIIIPVSLDETSPYGFVGKYQGLKCRDAQSSCDQIIEAIMEKPVSDKYKQIMVDAFVESTSFDDANLKGKQLMAVKSFSDKQLNELVLGYLSNNQVSGSWQGGRFIRSIVEAHGDQIDKPLLLLYRTFEEKGENIFYIDQNLIDRYIQAISSKRPDLTTNEIREILKRKREEAPIFAALYKVIKSLRIEEIEIVG